MSVFPAFFTGAVGVQLRAELGLGQAQLGAAVSAYFAAAAVTVAMLGRAVDRVGVRRSYMLGAGLAATSLVGVAILARSWWILAACLAAGGVGNAIVGPTSSRLLAHSITPGRRGFAFGLKQGSIMVATLLGGASVPLVAVTVGWRWVFLGGAGIALALFLMTPGDRMPVEAVDGEGLARNLPVTLLLLALAFGLGTAASVALTTFLADYAVDRGLAEGTAGLLLAAGSVGAIALRLLLGWWIDHGLRDVHAVIAGLFVVAAIAMLGLAVSGGALLMPMAIVAFISAWGWTGLLVYVVAVGNLAAPASATGYVQTGAASGGMLGPLLLGLVAERASYGVMWTIAAGLLVLACTCVWAAMLTERRIPS